MIIAVINGPNINLLGKREPEHYGTKTWDEIERKLVELSEELECGLLFFQSNYEGAIVDFIQENMDVLDGIVINPAGYSKTGYAILDAINAVHIPFVEIHLSNIFKRGSAHSETIFQAEAAGNIIGLRENVYLLGLRAMVEYVRNIRY
jgi:3-dehydroquinate dehydratase-2